MREKLGAGLPSLQMNVRRLAHRTQQSTQEIENAVSQLQQGSASAVKVMKNSLVESRQRSRKTSTCRWR